MSSWATSSFIFSKAPFIKTNFPPLFKRWWDIFIILGAVANALAVMTSNLFWVIRFGVVALSIIVAFVSCKVRIIFLIK